MPRPLLASKKRPLSTMRYVANDQGITASQFYLCTRVPYPTNLWKTPKECLEWLSRWQTQSQQLPTLMAVNAIPPKPEEYFQQNIHLVLETLFPTSSFYERPMDSYTHVIEQQSLPVVEWSMVQPMSKPISMLSNNQMVFQATQVNDLLHIPMFRRWLTHYESVRRELLMVYESKEFDYYPDKNHQSDCLWDSVVDKIVVGQRVQPLPLYPAMFENRLSHNYYQLGSHIRQFLDRAEVRDLQSEFRRIAQLGYQESFIRSICPFWHLVYEVYYARTNLNEMWKQLLQCCERLVKTLHGDSQAIDRKWLLSPLAPTSDGWSLPIALYTLQGQVDQLRYCNCTYATLLRRQQQWSLPWPQMVPPFNIELTRGAENAVTVVSLLQTILNGGTPPTLPAKSLPAISFYRWDQVISKDQQFRSPAVGKVTGEEIPSIPVIVETLDERLFTSAREVLVVFLKQRSRFGVDEATHPVQRLYELRSQWLIQPQGYKWFDKLLQTLYRRFVLHQVIAQDTYTTLFTQLASVDLGRSLGYFIKNEEWHTTQFNFILSMLEILCKDSTEWNAYWTKQVSTKYKYKAISSKKATPVVSQTIPPKVSTVDSSSSSVPISVQSSQPEEEQQPLQRP